jgi:hypothetical protein
VRGACALAALTALRRSLARIKHALEEKGLGMEKDAILTLHGLYAATAFKFAMFSVTGSAPPHYALTLRRRFDVGTSHESFLNELPDDSALLCFCAIPAVSPLPSRLLWLPAGAPEEARRALRDASGSGVWASLGGLEMVGTNREEATEMAFAQAKDMAEMDELADM